MFDFNKHIDRRNSGSVKWDMTKEFFGTDEVLPMWVADMDFEAPPEVIAALQTRITHGVYGYSAAGQSARESVAGWMKTRHSWEIDPEWIVFSPGVVSSISMAIQAYTNPGDTVVVQPPVYTPFFDMTKENGRKIAENPLLLKNGVYDIDFDNLEQKLSHPEAKLFLLCSPHNPGGRVWTAAELSRIGKLCIQHDVILISDEIHSDLLLFGKKHTPAASLSDSIADICITFAAPSKTFNLAGLQASEAIIKKKELRTAFSAVQHKNGIFTLNAAGAAALESAYTYGAKWLDSLLVHLQQNVLFAEKYLTSRIPALTLVKPHSTYLLWIDCRALKSSDAEIKRALLKNGLALESGEKFGAEGRGFVRMNIGCSLTTLKEGLKRLENAVSNLS
nr:MalY/PatB family protein [Metabacillus lacus]